MGLKPDENAIGNWEIVVLPPAHIAVGLSKCPTKMHFYRSLNYYHNIFLI